MFSTINLITLSDPLVSIEDIDGAESTFSNNQCDQVEVNNSFSFINQSELNSTGELFLKLN